MTRSNVMVAGNKLPILIPVPNDNLKDKMWQNLIINAFNSECCKIIQHADWPEAIFVYTEIIPWGIVYHEINYKELNSRIEGEQNSSSSSGNITAGWKCNGWRSFLKSTTMHLSSLYINLNQSDWFRDHVNIISGWWLFPLYGIILSAYRCLQYVRIRKWIYEESKSFHKESKSIHDESKWIQSY